MNAKKNRTRWYILVQCLLCISLLFVTYTLAFTNINVLGLQEQTRNSVNSTKTAIIGTLQALLGPFPTSTARIRTYRATFTPLPLISATPTPTATQPVTPLASSTSTRIVSATPRDRERPDSILFSTPIPTNPPPPAKINPAPTSTKAPPPTETEPPLPTEPPTEPTEPPTEPTEPPTDPTEPPVEPQLTELPTEP